LLLPALASALALPRLPAIGPFPEALLLAVSAALVIISTRHRGLQLGLLVAIVCGLVSGLLFQPWPESGMALLTSGPQGVLAMTALMASLTTSEPKRQPTRKTSQKARTGEALLVADASGRVLEASAALGILLGYSLTELRETSLAELVTQRQLSGAERERFESDGQLESILKLRRKDGSELTMRSRMLVVEQATPALYVLSLTPAPSQPPNGHSLTATTPISDARAS
jgi:PAS domain S-box-containing protein